MSPLVQSTALWYIQPHHYARLAADRSAALDRFSARLAPEAQSDFERYVEKLAEYVSLYIPQRQKATIDPNGVGHIQILGPLAQGLAPIDKIFGMTDFADIRAEAASLVAQGAERILVRATTPGGTVHGTPETAALLSALEVPWAVHVDDQLASAGYYALAGAAFISAAPSADVGSIGVIIPWIDAAAYWERLGLRWDPIVSAQADLKGAGGGPTIAGPHRDYLQAQVNLAETDFRHHVAAHRYVDSSAMRGQTLRAPEALEAGLVDYVETADSAYSRLLSTL